MTETPLAQLTDFGNNLLASVMANYRTKMLGTGPCDQGAVEAAIAGVYSIFPGNEVPKRFVWVDSPAAAAHYYLSRAASIKPALNYQFEFADTGDYAKPSVQAFIELAKHVGAESPEDAIPEERVSFAAPHIMEVAQCVDEALVACDLPVFSPVSRFGAGIGKPGYHMAAALAPWAFADGIGMKFHPTLRSLLNFEMALCDAGWWWTFEDTVIVSQRPSMIRIDANGHLHSTTGPAIIYPDGFSAHAWRGGYVPPEFFDEDFVPTNDQLFEARASASPAESFLAGRRNKCLVVSLAAPRSTSAPKGIAWKIADNSEFTADEDRPPSPFGEEELGGDLDSFFVKA